MYTVEEMSEVLNANESVLLNYIKNLPQVDTETPFLKHKYFIHEDGEWSITFKGALYLLAFCGVDEGITACLDRFEYLYLLKNGIGGCYD